MAEALEDLQTPGAGDFFGRIDTSDGPAGEQWYIGRRHIEDDQHDPVVVDWRAPIAAPFYRATAADPLGVDLRRRFTLDEGELTAYLDEHLDDPDAADVAGGIPDPVLAEIGAERTGAMREIVATIQAEQDLVIRAPLDQVLVVQGGPGTGKTAVALHRAAYLLFEHRRRLARDGVLVIGPNRAFLDYIGNVLPSLGERSVRQCTVGDLCTPKVVITGVDDPATARAKGDAGMLDELELSAMLAVTPPATDVVVPIGARRVTFASRRDRRVAGPRRRWRRPVQPAPPPAASDRPAGAPPAHRPRRQLVGRRAAAQGARRGVADAAAGPSRRPSAARPAWPPAGVDGRRPAPRRRGQLDPQRPAARLRTRRRRRGPGPLRRRPARDRPAQPDRLDDARRRRRPVDDARRPGTLGRRVHVPRRRRQGDRRDRRADDRLSCAGTDPHRRQPAAAADRRRRQRQPQRPRRGPRPDVGPHVAERPRRHRRLRHGPGEAPPPVDRSRRPGGVA